MNDKSEALLRAMTAVDGELAADAAPERAVPARRRPRGAVIAALAAALALLVGAGIVFPSRFGTLTGGGFFHNDHHTSMYPGPELPLAPEDGRLYFVLDGAHMDLTGIMDQETPYIYSAVNPDTGTDFYVAMGGTADHYGCAELWYDPSDGFVRCDFKEGGVETPASGFSQWPADTFGPSCLEPLQSEEALSWMFPWLTRAVEELVETGQLP